jgi:NADPH:quinone reductase-like Zn-dependent oxidoreductase
VDENGTMRAAVFDDYGPPEVLYEGRVARPAPGPGEVLVRVRAASVNGGELAGRAGRLRLVTDLAQRGSPKQVGIDYVGDVVEVGSDVTGVAVGERVWGILSRSFGSMAEYVVVPPDRFAPAPAGLDPAEAAALPVGTTSITALRDVARIRPGERLLVRGAAGGVGVTAVQLGRAFGARVTGLARAEHLDLVRELGAAEALDYRTTVPSGLDRFDVVLDTVGTDLRSYRHLLAPGGRMVAISFDLDRMVRSLAYLVGSAVHGAQRVRFFSGNPRRDLFEELTRLAESGALRPVVDRVHPLSEIAAAHRALEAGGVRGKVVVTVP